MHKHTMEVVADRSIMNECQGMKLLSFYLSVSALSLYPYVKDKSGVIPVHRHHERNQNGTRLHTRFGKCIISQVRLHGTFHRR